MGGTLARYAAAGIRVVVVTATLGEEGEIIPPDLHQLTAAGADQLGGYRYWELQHAAAELGLADHRLLGGPGTFRDSGMAGTPSADHPRAFVRAQTGGPDHDRAVQLLAELIDVFCPALILTYDTDGGYGHPDHIAAHQIAVAAAARAAVPAYAVVKPSDVLAEAIERLPVPDGYLAGSPDHAGYRVPPGGYDVAVDVSRFDRRRRAAMAAHATQLTMIPGGFALTNRIAQPLLPTEYFRALPGPRQAGGPLNGFPELDG